MNHTGAARSLFSEQVGLCVPGELCLVWWLHELDAQGQRGQLLPQQVGVGFHLTVLALYIFALVWLGAVVEVAVS
jgi:hypothetical protein